VLPRHHLFDTIVSLDNLEGAYLDLVRRFAESGRSNRYAGMDGLRLDDVALSSAALLRDARAELLELAPIEPALHMRVRKDDGGERSIYTYTIKSRIKAEAIHRVVAPLFEAELTDFVHSYRSSHPQHVALRSVARRYRRRFGQDTVHRFDIARYTESLDRDILRGQIARLGLDPPTRQLIDLFVDNPFVKRGVVERPARGVLTGVPLVGLFANLYLNQLDAAVGRRVALYRRVGDDGILFDGDAGRVREMAALIEAEAASLGLTMAASKRSLTSSDQPFSFLGHDFCDGHVRIGDRAARRARARWRRMLRYYPATVETKLRRLPGLLYRGGSSIHDQFIQLLRAFRQVTDHGQVAGLSAAFFRCLTVHFWGSHSHRHQRLTRRITSGMPIPSLHRYFADVHNGRQTLASLSLSKTERHPTRGPAARPR
jgi:hypothetical protein